MTVKALAPSLPAQAWRTVTWRQGACERLSSRFARLRVRPAHRDEWRSQPWPEEWLLIEWPKGESEPTKYWLSSLPDDIGLRRLVDTAKLRWRIEHDYQELKQEVGLGHFEGRGWRGFHHHATLCIAAYGFLVSERGAIPPSVPRRSRPIPFASVPADRKPRGSAATDRAVHCKFDRDNAAAPRTWTRPTAVEMPTLCDRIRTTNTDIFVTQQDKAMWLKPEVLLDVEISRAHRREGGSAPLLRRLP